jgi:hypothetical protein
LVWNRWSLRDQAVALANERGGFGGFARHNRLSVGRRATDNGRQIAK